MRQIQAKDLKLKGILHYNFLQILEKCFLENYRVLHAAQPLLLEHVVGGEVGVGAAFVLVGVAVLHRQDGGRVPLRCLMIQMLLALAAARVTAPADSSRLIGVGSPSSHLGQAAQLEQRCRRPSSPPNLAPK